MMHASPASLPRRAIRMAALATLAVTAVLPVAAHAAPLRIGMTFQELNNPYFVTMQKALNDAAASIGAQVFVTDARLQVPENVQSPIAGRVDMTTLAGAEITADLDFLQTGPQTSDITAWTDDGVLKLSLGGLTESASDTGLAYGFGANFHITKSSYLQATWTSHYDDDGVKLEGLGLAWGMKFSSGRRAASA